jgi:dUTP pyrophosphatase
VKEILFTASPDANHPYRAYPGDAGFDLSCLNHGIIAPKQQTDLPTGLSVQLPDGVWGWITGRSSTTAKGLDVIPGVIDEGYRGPLFVRVRNYTDQAVTVREGERLGQMIPIYQVPDLVFRQVERLDPSPRGENGFGSSG